MLSIDRRTAVRLAALAFVAAGLTACASSAGPEQPTALNPLRQYPFKVEQMPDELALAPHREGLSPNQRAYLADFVSRWRGERSEVTVRTPTEPLDPDAVSRTASDLIGALQALGVPAAMVRTGPYPVAAPDAPITVSFLRYEASIPDCASTWGNMTSTGSNLPTGNFGCSTSANLAALVANPRDLVTPTPMDPSDITRRNTVLGRYRRGEVMSSARDEQAVGSISNAVR